ncbi:MAG TPA: SRPBCC family protein [Edaphobacter sp.]|nr:SRPBCC family protein [Edaphobacter sp.]
MAQGTLANVEDREITDTRVVNAPRELIWKVWTEPVHVTQWWGPKGFTNTTHSMDVKVGGEWVHTMHGPDGRDYPNRIVYKELVEPERIVYEHISSPWHRTTVTFEDLGGKTKLTFQMLFETAEHKRKIVEEYKAVEGLSQTLGRLEDYLAKVS